MNNKHCFDLRDEIKDYLFIDSIYKNARLKKDKLIRSINMFVSHYQETLDNMSEYWAITYLYQITIGGTICCMCGDYLALDHDVMYSNVSRNALCHCNNQYYQNILLPLNIYY